MTPEEVRATRFKQLGLAGGLLAFVVVLLLPRLGGMPPLAQRTLAVGLWMVIWWITEATHLAITALIPLATFPLLGIMPSAQVAPHYANHLIFLFLGGFVIALAMEKWDLHKRIALGVVARVGQRLDRLVLAFTLATGCLSMWISNTATTLMMLPIAMAVVNQAAELIPPGQLPGGVGLAQIRASLGLALMLAIAYGSSIGGVGTLVGTPTNIALVGFLHERFPQQPPISFYQWMLIGVPLVAVFLPFTAFYLCWLSRPVRLTRVRIPICTAVIEQERQRLGPMKTPEKATLVVGLVTAGLWIFREPIQLGWWSLPGWSQWLPWGGHVHDATVAMFSAGLLCLLPARLRGPLEWRGRQERFVMDWNTIQQRLPWDVLLLFGGGFALAAGVEQSGLASWLAQQAGALRALPLWGLVMFACLLTAVLGSVASNVATVLMLCPVLTEAALRLGVHPYLLLVPATVMASFDFLLPVGTPPNAIIFSSGWVTVPAMFRAGLGLQLVSVVLVPLLVYLLGGRVFGF